MCCVIFAKKQMDKQPLKQKILTACRELIRAKAAELKDAMKEAQKAANDYGPPRDRYDAFRSQLLRKKDMYGQQLAKVNEQVEALDQITTDQLFDVVKHGAVVITDFQKLFISTSLGKFEVEGEIYFAISGAVPVFKAMEGLKAGESYAFNGKKIKILNVF